MNKNKNKNKNKLKIVASVIAMIGVSNAIAQNNVNANFDTTATIESFCSINAGDINFGVVNLPLTAQSANAQMNVLCSNSTPYTVDLSYGQYISGSTNIDGYTIEFSSYGNNSIKNYTIYDSSSSYVGILSCGYNTLKGKVSFNHTEIANIYGSSAVDVWIPDTTNICVSDGKLNGTYPTGWVGDTTTVKNNQPLSVSVSNAFGSMSGTMKGDSLAYKITLPNDSTKTWTKGLSNYSSTGSGTEQIITVNAQVVPDKSSSLYVAEDVYRDNITATISY